ncbi:hypothetical protein KHA94_17465 [Bacillus sp. FJAT-49705]|uniref:DUF4926 domain-containing protein n=1 Tax=Cytobacillus citreus TaxID=2833586 RepID=A0ABS5NXX1_9BACI|nr:hypothetical protein [Cytobacillus citreus]MBS4191958.1 hypothetical protein [Cytobacillus citreus]
MVYIDKIVKELLKYKTGTVLKITWDSNYTGTYELDTFYDTDNGLEMNETDYKEFHVALVKERGKGNNFIEIGNSKDTPVSIEILNTGEVIWCKK